MDNKTSLLEDKITPSIILIHEHHNVPQSLELSNLLKTFADVKLAFNVPAEEVFHNSGVPSIYIVGYNDSKFGSIQTTAMEKDVKWVRNYHPAVTVISMHYTHQRDIFEKAGV